MKYVHDPQSTFDFLISRSPLFQQQRSAHSIRESSIQRLSETLPMKLSQKVPSNFNGYMAINALKQLQQARGTNSSTISGNDK